MRISSWYRSDLKRPIQIFENSTVHTRARKLLRINPDTLTWWSSEKDSLLASFLRPGQSSVFTNCKILIPLHHFLLVDWWKLDKFCLARSRGADGPMPANSNGALFYPSFEGKTHFKKWKRKFEGGSAESVEVVKSLSFLGVLWRIAGFHFIILHPKPP